jgi:hypothetical protein
VADRRQEIADELIAKNAAVAVDLDTLREATDILIRLASLSVHVADELRLVRQHVRSHLDGQ